MKLTLKVQNAAGETLAATEGENRAALHYTNEYCEGDTLCLTTDSPGCHVVVQLEDSIAPTLCYLAGESYSLKIPFGEKRVSYSPKSFTGQSHLLTAHAATPTQTAARRNLALNPLDCHENETLFPHATANVETRGEAVFAARNAINGNTANHGHGSWPFESWGINQQDDAVIHIAFGREVLLDGATLTLRADFPHDNWWQQATLRFSDNTREILYFQKSDAPQTCLFPGRLVSWAELCELKKDPEDPSPFPALTQLELWGSEK